MSQLQTEEEDKFSLDNHIHNESNDKLILTATFLPPQITFYLIRIYGFQRLDLVSLLFSVVCHCSQILRHRFVQKKKKEFNKVLEKSQLSSASHAVFCHNRIPHNARYFR